MQEAIAWYTTIEKFLALTLDQFLYGQCGPPAKKFAHPLVRRLFHFE